MTKLIVKGGNKLKGTVRVGGSKNATLPIMCASLLCSKKVTLKNIPEISDVNSLATIFESIGAVIERKDGVITIDPTKLKKKRIPDDLVCKMRASILILGALIPRFKEVEMAFPGGCVLGKRSVHSHTYALQQLGCKIIDDKTKLHIKATQLKGNKIILPERSVTGTENAVMASVLAAGTTHIHMAAAEPHVQDLCNFLNKMGAKISGIGTSTLTIKGVKSLKGGDYTIIGDYLEAGTYAIAAAATGGEVKITGINPDDLDSFWQKLDEIGVNFTLGKNYVEIHETKSIKATEFKTAVYPGFPTDIQAPFTVLLTRAKGVSKVFETLFEGRLNYLAELERMKAKVELLNPHQAIVIGPTKLKGIPISSYDIRAGAGMVIAALMADGITEITNIKYIDRGYEKLDKKLRKLGADIKRVEED